MPDPDFGRGEERTTLRTLSSRSRASPLQRRKRESQPTPSPPTKILPGAQTERQASRRKNRERTKAIRSRSEGVLKQQPRTGPTLQTIPSEESLKSRHTLSGGAEPGQLMKTQATSPRT